MVFFYPTLPTRTPTTQTFLISRMSAHVLYSDAMVLVTLSLIPMASPTLSIPSYAFLLLLIPPTATCSLNILSCFSPLDPISRPVLAPTISLPSSQGC